MMISPESYYEEYLNEKTKEEIMTAIRGLKQIMGRLKTKMEDPDYDGEAMMFERIYWTRKYLELAKEAYHDAGGN